MKLVAGALFPAGRNAQRAAGAGTIINEVSEQFIVKRVGEAPAMSYVWSGSNGSKCTPQTLPRRDLLKG
jgi:hypothetical protein